MKAAVLHEAFCQIDDCLIVEAEKGKYNEEARKQKASLWKRVGAIAACICFVAAVFALKDAVKTGTGIDTGGSKVGDSQHLLDSSAGNSNASGEEIIDSINEFDASSIDEVFVYINASTASGTAIKLTESEDPECLSELVSMLFNDEIIFEETSSEYDGTGYSFYITYTDTKTRESYTVFVFDDETIRCDGLFLKASSPLDYTAINKAIKKATDLKDQQ